MKMKTLLHHFKRFCHSLVPSIESREHHMTPSLGEQRLLKVAILGRPNSGKSTLVNQLIGHNVMGVSPKVHTTKQKALGVLTEGCHQVVLLDTPGVVPYQIGRKFQLSKAFVTDPLRSTEEANLLLVMVDAADKYTRMRLDPSITSIIENSSLPLALVLNKVDLVRHKHTLLQIVQSLVTSCSHPSPSSSASPSPSHSPFPVKFQEVFMISALTSDGIDKLKDYLFSSTLSIPWEYDGNTITDQSPEVIVEEIIRERLFYHLDKEIPYVIKQTPVIWEMKEGTLCILKNITCTKRSQASIVIGPGGQTIQNITTEAKERIEQLLGCQVNLELFVNHNK